jgi:hypothetical protein
MNSTELDKKHKSLLSWFNKKAKRTWWYDNEMKMLVAHTADFRDARENPDLGIVGLYDTLSPANSSEQNCFAFPISKGGWVIRRYGQSTPEHNSWETDDQGWTKIKYNIMPTFERSCQFREGALDSNDFFNFHNGTDINLVFSDLKIDYAIPDVYKGIMFAIRKKKNRIIIRVSQLQGTPEPEGFLKKSNYFEKVIIYNEAIEIDDSVLTVPDDLIRHVNSLGKEAGWYVKIASNWVMQSKTNIADVIQALNPSITAKDIKVYMGNQIINPWILEHKPFAPEYLGARKWNKDAPQLAYEPLPGDCDSWLRMLNHVGSELNKYVLKDEWCQHAGIETGGDYLLHWIAYLFQKPEQPLPYLFLWSKEQETGKSTLHESITLLLKDSIGSMRADHALQSQTGFNKELENCVLAYVEETDLSGSSGAANKIKDYVTSLYLSIRAMHTDAYMVENNTHWIQTSNSSTACPIVDGDTRIVSMKVPSITHKIPKHELRTNLIDEAPCFTYLIMNMELPDPI